MTETTAQTFSGEKFLEQLREDSVISPLVITGMAKKPEDDSNHILFAVGTNCSNWVQRPVDGIERVEVLNVVPCKDHTHPLVNLYMKQPSTTEGVLLASLLGVPVADGHFPTLRL